MDHLCIGRRETDSLASRYKCISSPRHDSVSSFVFGGEAENQISRRPPSSIPPLAFDCQGPQRASEVAYPTKEREKERTRWRFPNVPLSPVPSLLPSNRQRETARGGRHDDRRLKNAARPSINAASSPFSDTFCTYYGSLVGGSVCYVYPQGL